MQAVQDSPWSALCAGVAPSLPQSAIEVPNLNPGLGLHELRSSAAHQVHRAGFHTRGQWEKATGKLCASDQQHTFRGLLLYI